MCFLVYKKFPYFMPGIIRLIVDHTFQNKHTHTHTYIQKCQKIINEPHLDRHLVHTHLNFGAHKCFFFANAI